MFSTFRKTASFFSNYIFSQRNKIIMGAAILTDFAIFTVNALPTILIAEEEDKNNKKDPIKMYVVFGAALVLGQVLPKLRNLLLDLVAVDMQAELSSSIQQESFAKPMEKQVEARVGELTTVLFSNYMSTESIVPALFGEIIPTLTNAAGITIILAAKHPYTWVAAFPPGLYLLNIITFSLSGGKTRKIRHDFTELKHDFFMTVQESVNCYPIAHQFGNVPYEINKVRAILNDSSKMNLRSRRLHSLTNLGHSFLNQTGLVAFFICTLKAYINGDIKQYSFATLGYLMFYFARNLDALGAAFHELNISYDDAVKIAEFHSTPPMSNMPKLDLVGAPSIRFEKVKAGYTIKNENKEEIFNTVLDDFNLEVKQGETVAIVGKSGIGKSTIMNLLLRFYNPSSGKIFINETDISTVSPVSLREHIAMVSQDPNLFNDTVSNNVKYGKMDATHKEIREVAELACLSASSFKHAATTDKKHTADKKDKISANKIPETVLKITDEKKDSIDEMLNAQAGNKGARLSGGERQRVAFARAYLRGGVIFLADEATNALDPETEEKVLGNFNHVKQGATVILTTHKLYTLGRVDRICVLDNGKIVEEGNFNELIKKRKIFYTQLEAQYSELGKTLHLESLSTNDSKSTALTKFSITQNWAVRTGLHNRHQNADTKLSSSNASTGVKAPLLRNTRDHD